MISATDTFYRSLGLFYANHLSSEALIDYSIGKFLNLSAKRTHVITTYIEYGRKAAWLHDLIKESKHSKKSDLIVALKVLRNTKRNVFAHSYLWVHGDSVEFIEKKPEKVQSHFFTKTQLASDVNEVVRYAIAFKAALPVTDAELDAFIKAALKRKNKSKTSS